jgi:hypothetical protein
MIEFRVSVWGSIAKAGPLKAVRRNRSGMARTAVRRKL